MSAPQPLNYTQEQVAVAQTDTHRLLVEALAGTGKTATVTLRIQEQVTNGVDPASILALSFTKSGEAALKARLKAARLGRVQVRTIDAYARETYTNVFQQRANVSTSDRLFTYALNDLDAHAHMTVHELRRLASWHANEHALDYGRHDTALVHELLDRYAFYKTRFNVMDFDDLMREVSQVVVGAFEEVILDEAQDMKHWHREFITGLSRSRITLVGDPHQAIFGFAGIAADALTQHREAWTVLPLTKSFRSRRELLTMPNLLVGSTLTSDRDGGTVNVYEDRTQKAAHIAEAVLEDGTQAVLVRTRHQGEFIARALHRLGVKVGRSWASRDGDVLVSTVHAAKGLEWDSVRVVGLGEEGWRYATVNDDEERRLLYVALTRARERIDIHHFNGMPWGL